jgi:hypothetical protein
LQETLRREGKGHGIGMGIPFDKESYKEEDDGDVEGGRG